MTASQSSISPQRRSLPQEGPSPFQLPAQQLYSTNPPPVLSPQSYGHNNGYSGAISQNGPNPLAAPVPQHGHRLRDRNSMQGGSHNGRAGYSGQILPTPDPTVASCISDEDVARTLIALGDASNFSHGRTSNSTMDDTFSGHADAASSTGATSDSDEYSDAEGGLPKYRKQLDEGDDEYDHGALIKSEFDEYDGPPKTKKIKTKMHDGPTNGYHNVKSALGSKIVKAGKARVNTLPKPAKPATTPGLMKAPTAPATPTQHRKTSSASSTLNFQHQLGVDEEDLSSKPRCQRCRKSKKGCDRQRPCQRCKDAGIGAEGCLSEDEGNGRKGRYGRHMGVSVKKTAEQAAAEEDHAASSILTEMAAGYGSPDKSKKRKR